EPPRTTEPKLCVAGASASAAGLSAKLAVTGFDAWLSARSQGPAPEQGGDQPVNVCTPSGVAVRRTDATLKVEVHVPPLLRPLGGDAPVPPPALVTATWAVPVPFSAAAAAPPGFAETLSETPDFEPTDAGEKATEIVQLIAGSSGAAQLFSVILKSAT